MWETELVTLLRFLIDDLDTPQLYTDSRLVQFIIMAAKMAKSEIQFRQDYVIDITNQTITPDPCDPNNPDDNFQVLVTLKAACILAGSKLKTKGSGGFIIIDGPTKTDTTQAAKGYQFAAQEACKDYKEARIQFVNGSFTGGRAILSAFRVGYGGNGNYCGDRRGNYF